MKIVKSFEESGLLIKGVGETIRNAAKVKKGGFLSMLLSTSTGISAVNARLGQASVFNAASSFNKFCNTKVVSK